jgi:hypothetical protein
MTILIKILQIILALSTSIIKIILLAISLLTYIILPKLCTSIISYEYILLINNKNINEYLGNIETERLINF